MAKALSFPHFFNKKHHQGDEDVFENLTVSVRDNYFTFNGWAANDSRAYTGETITKRLYRNFATFMEWGK